MKFLGKLIAEGFQVWVKFMFSLDLCSGHEGSVFVMLVNYSVNIEDLEVTFKENIVGAVQSITIRRMFMRVKNLSRNEK